MELVRNERIIRTFYERGLRRANNKEIELILRSSDVLKIIIKKEGRDYYEENYVVRSSMYTYAIVTRLW